jgi:hypothetical protein
MLAPSAADDPYKSRGGQMGAWTKAWHDGAGNVLVRLCNVADLRLGTDMDAEVPYLFTRYRPATSGRSSSLAARTCISRTVAPTGSNFRAPPPPQTLPSRTVANDMTIAATQTFNNGQ